MNIRLPRQRLQPFPGQPQHRRAETDLSDRQRDTTFVGDTGICQNSREDGVRIEAALRQLRPITELLRGYAAEQDLPMLIRMLSYDEDAITGMHAAYVEAKLNKLLDTAAPHRAVLYRLGLSRDAFPLAQQAVDQLGN